MNTANRDQIIDLHRAAVNARGAAEHDGGLWPAANAADDAFLAFVISLETAEGPG